MAPKEQNPARGEILARRRGRALTLQALYEIDITGHEWRAALANQSEQFEAALPGRPFAEVLLEGIQRHRADLDSLIRRHAPAFPVEQMAVVDRNILRLALYELRFAMDAPAKAVVNEAVELAKTYGGDASPRFINGALGAYLDANGPETNDQQRT